MASVGKGSGTSSSSLASPPPAGSSSKGSEMQPQQAPISTTLLRPLLVVALAVWALGTVEISPEVADTTLIGGITIDKWHRSLETLALLYGCWQVGTVLLLALLGALSRQTQTAADDAVLELVGSYVKGSTGGPRLAVLYLGLYLATNEPLSLPTTHPILALYLSKGLTLIMGLWALCLSWDMLQLFLLRTWREGPQVKADPTLVSALGFARPIAIFAGLLALLHKVGVEVSSVIAGFGVGGLAVALSTQTVLQDLSAGLALLVDRPFELGDFVSTGGFKGFVTSIGLKSTTFTAESGEVLVACNNGLANGRVSKFPPVCDRLKTFTLPLDTETPDATLQALPGLIQKLLEGFSARWTEGGRLEPGFVGVSELTGWCVQLECNYTLRGSRLRELKTLHNAVLLASLDLLRAQGVKLVAPPDL